MADISQLSKPARKGDPPKTTETADNLRKPATGSKVLLQLKVTTETRKSFKTYAAAHDMMDNQLFDKVWDYYLQNHG